MFDTTSQGGGILPNGCLVQPGGEVWFPIGHTLPPELIRSGQRVVLPPSAFQSGASLPQNAVPLQAVQTTPHAFSRQGSYSRSQLEIGVHQNEFELQRSQMTSLTHVQCPLMKPLDIPIQVQRPMRQPLVTPTPVHCPMQQPLEVPTNAQYQMQQPLDVPFIQPLDLSYTTVQNPGQDITKHHVQADVPEPSECPPQHILDLERSVLHELAEPSKAFKEHFYEQKATESTLQIYSGNIPHCDPNEILAVKLDPKVKPVFPKMVNPACEQFACVDLSWGEMDHLLESAVITCPTPASGNTSAVFSLDDLVDMLSETRDNKLDSGAQGITEGGLSAHLTTGVPSPAFGPATAAVVNRSNAQMTNISSQSKSRQNPNKRRVPTARVKPQPKKRKLVLADLKSQNFLGSPSKPGCFITDVGQGDETEPHPKQRKVYSEDLKWVSSPCSDCIITQVHKVLDKAGDKLDQVPAQVNHEVKVTGNEQQTGGVNEPRDEDAMDTRDDDGHLTFKIPQALRRLFC